jgi:ribosomal protein S18 acetylase RimI-like enzyme
MTLPHLLDRPVWSMLTGRQAHLAEGDVRTALRIDRGYGPFGAAIDRSEEAQMALAAHVPEDGELWIVEGELWPLPPGTQEVKCAILAQMVAERCVAASASEYEIIPLGDGDAAEMAALAAHAQPGPWGPKTHLYGPFFGIRESGRLLAMAGQRMLMPGMAEVSGVATWADCRGRGYARALISHVMRQMRASGEQPFLHSYADNAGAIALYRSLGFEIRREVHALVISRI